MNTTGVRAAIYLRVSRDDQTTENQRLVLERVAGHRGWLIVQTYEDQGFVLSLVDQWTSTSKCRSGVEQRP